MKTILWKLKTFYQRFFGKPVVKDLLTNDHAFCLHCGDLYYRKKKNQVFCTASCRIAFNNFKRKK